MQQQQQQWSGQEKGIRGSEQDDTQFTTKKMVHF
jgi:hypothetical protein